MSLRFKTTWQHVRRAPYQALAAIMIMTLTFLVGLVFSVLSIGADRYLAYLETKPEIKVYFKDTITSEEQVADYKQKLIASGKAVNIRFITKEDALKIYQDRFKEDKLQLELVTAKTLPASLEFGSKNLDDLPMLYALVKTAPDIEEISYGKDIAGDLSKIVSVVRKAGLILVGFLIFVSLLVVLTVVGMKIALRKDEIVVERLVGASKWYIRWPFILEGILYGVAGALLAWGGVTTLLYLVTPMLSAQLAESKVFPLPLDFYLILLGSALGTSIVIGAVGSFLAVRRYLRD